MAKDDKQELFTVRIISPKNVLFEGKAISITSVNSAGKFDILAEHANFITFIENQPILITKDTLEKVKFQFPFAIIYLSQNQVTIYTDIKIEIP